jgi:hypothetical protein
MGQRVFAKWNLDEFVRESNRIEGIASDPTQAEIEATAAFVNLAFPTTANLETFVAAVAPGHRLRDQYGLDVRVGDHIAPRGAPEIRTALDTIMARVADGADLYDPWQVHIDYETLHPFTDGNGRSGRVLWLWQMQAAPIGFLHQFYYQTLSRVRALTL